MLDPTLEDILSRLKANDQSALQTLFEQHYPSVCRAIFRLVREQGLTEDLAQNVFIRFWEKREQLMVTTSIGAYLHRMAINEALAHLRKQRWVDPALDIPDSPTDTNAEDLMLQKELGQHISDAINRLPPKCKLIFQLSRYEELTYREIAERLDISVKTVENQMGKALRHMRERLSHYL